MRENLLRMIKKEKSFTEIGKPFLKISISFDFQKMIETISISGTSPVY